LQPFAAQNAAVFQAPLSQTKLQGGSSIRPTPMSSRPMLECT